MRGAVRCGAVLVGDYGTDVGERMSRGRIRKKEGRKEKKQTKQE